MSGISGFFKSVHESTSNCASQIANKVVTNASFAKTHNTMQFLTYGTTVIGFCIKEIGTRIAKSIRKDGIETQQQPAAEMTISTNGEKTAPIATSVQQGLVDGIETTQQSHEEIIKSEDGKQIMKKELTPPGSLFLSNGVVNANLAIQTIAIHELPDVYFENVSSFDQIKNLPNKPAIQHATQDLDSLQRDILSKIDKEITQLNDNPTQNKEQIENLQQLYYSTQNKIKTLKENLTNALERLKNCKSEEDVNYINEQLKTYQTNLGKITSNLSKNYKIISSITMPSVRTGEIQAIRDSKDAKSTTISYINLITKNLKLL